MSIVHVYPINDVIEHDIEEGLNCQCNPEIEINSRGEALIIHSALDGRPN